MAALAGAFVAGAAVKHFAGSVWKKLTGKKNAPPSQAGG